MAKKQTAAIGDYVSISWVDHCEYEDVPQAHDGFKLIKFSTFGQLVHVDDEKIHLTRTVHEAEESSKNTVLIVGRGMVTGVDLYRKVGTVELP
jgi:hypothetical protein